MRFVLMVWVTFRGIRSRVFKQSYAIAAELRKVPLEIFFNPAILSDDNLFSEFVIFLHLLSYRGINDTVICNSAL